MDKVGVDWNTMAVAAIVATPVTIAVLKMHRDLVTKMLPKVFEHIVAAIDRLNDRAERRHEENISALQHLENAITVCRFGGKLAKKHAQNAAPSHSGNARKGKTHPKKKARGKKR